MTTMSRQTVGLSLIAVLLLVGCGASAATPSPTASSPPASAQASPSAGSAAPPASSAPSESVTQAPSTPSEPVIRACPPDELHPGCWAELTVERTPRDGPDGEELSLDPFDGHPIEPYPVGTRLFPHEQSARGDWWKVQVPPFEQRYGGDIFGWFAARDLAPSETPACPTEISRDALADIEQPDRLVCFGSRELELDGAVWGTSEWPTWRVQPEWFGDPGSPRVFGLAPAVTVGMSGREIPAGVPESVDPLPSGVHVRVTGSFDHPEAAECVRSQEHGEPIEELPTDSVTWCRQRFAVNAWEVIGGAEGRPYDGTLQLHRLRPVEGEVGCDTMGIPYTSFTIRIDPDALVQVWGDADVGEDLFIFWEPTFTAGDENDPVARGPNGEVVARDGDVIEVDDWPDGFGGYRWCPGTNVTVYDQPAS